jgi:N-methylhydantoinase B
MGNITGIRRTQELIDKYSLKTVDFYAKRLMDYAVRLIRHTIMGIPDGTYSFEDFMDDDGFSDEGVRIHVSVTIQDDTAILDFRESSPQVGGSINAVYAITLSAVLYVFRSLVARDIPTNGGILRPITLLTQKGTVVDAQFPAAVAGGNVETSQRIVDVILGSLAQALPGKIPAASQGTMNNVTIGGIDPRNGNPFAYYETIGGGMGATAGGEGESGVHSHMTNTLNTPIEALEYSYPFLVTEYSIRRGTGGKGLHKGGDGIVREIHLQSDAEITVLSERRRLAPYGLQGGESGVLGKNVIFRGGKPMDRPGKFSTSLKKNDIVRIETPGGGGYGKRA